MNGMKGILLDGECQSRHAGLSPHSFPGQDNRIYRMSGMELCVLHSMTALMSRVYRHRDDSRFRRRRCQWAAGSFLNIDKWDEWNSTSDSIGILKCGVIPFIPFINVRRGNIHVTMLSGNGPHLYGPLSVCYVARGAGYAMFTLTRLAFAPSVLGSTMLRTPCL